jgi:cysteine desulfurase
MRRVYLDYAATTPVRPEVVEAMLPCFTDTYGNPSSIHFCGQAAKEAMEKARSKVAALIDAQDNEVVFTGSGTEADNFALEGVAFAREGKGKHIIVSAIEHHAVLETAHFLEGRGFRITVLPVDKYGMVDPQQVKGAISGDTILVSIMHANNEIGTVQPIAEIGNITREAGVYLHTDAVQTVGRITVSVEQLGVDLLSMSAHKLYGPKGVGALYIRKGTKIASHIHGGAQEESRRASTENVPGIVGFGRAAELAGEELSEEAKRLPGLRDRLIAALLESIGHSYLNGHPQQRLPNNVNISIEYVEGEAMCVNLDLQGICASTGSACSSSDLAPSHVLLATGISPELARGSLRFTLGKWSTEEDVQYVLDTLPDVVVKLRAMSPLLKGSKRK